LLRDMPGVTLRRILPSTTRPSSFVYVIQLHPGTDRSRVMAHLEERRIPSRIYFSPIHLQPYYRKRFGYREGDFPVTERVAASILALPFHANLLPDDMQYVADALRSAVVRAAA
jgi:perosamine synthetase